MTKPFNQEYVLSTTLSHMQKCVDTSIKKTFDRIPEFMADDGKSKEIFKTLAQLHGLKNLVDAQRPPK